MRMNVAKGAWDVNCFAWGPLSVRDSAWDMKTSLEGIAWHGLREVCMSWHGGRESVAFARVSYGNCMRSFKWDVGCMAVA